MQCTPHQTCTHTFFHGVYSTTSRTEVHSGTPYSTSMHIHMTMPTTPYVPLPPPPHLPQNGSISEGTGVTNSTHWVILASTDSPDNITMSTALLDPDLNTSIGARYARAQISQPVSSKIGLVNRVELQDGALLDLENDLPRLSIYSTYSTTSYVYHVDFLSPFPSALTIYPPFVFIALHDLNFE